ncbi:hypothetical protein BATDEDRAFT_85070 [Batrachochytrium dendrobatidis JAM81]|uniref:Dymeclin n=1 Tax=Batrachochytrium dendrobatidis (strain JAM81 / FGSC 10211) TaxID=684364 RepID=F4NTM2_BATDJ|nr:uncharacterized protein BATDEDRAFT_85070 [Batrachochytrium dendrobatidis JAM81]EGF83527.1 hypothetical protein BATDEDRAFT_85070 [Batrachochytrium dendrobatidis JAM81]|eukprot:XP_006676127.1 hypothetical protein BATDEDRAFT_85070 [Batrachochytrium dendrobatidis JAM81]
MGAAESKLAFRKNVFALYEHQAIPQDNQAFWDSFLELPDTPENVFNLISPKDVRKIIQEHPENIKMLVQKVSAHILGFSQLTSRPQPKDIKEVLNAVRILTRLLPFIFELDDGGVLESSMFWDNEIKESVPQSTAEAKDGGIPTLGSRLAIAAVQLLFYQKFTLPDLDTDSENVRFSIWLKGVGATDSLPTSRDEIIHRIEVLRLLFTMMSCTLYCKPNQLIENENKWTNVVISKLEKKHALCLLCSLLNTITTYDPIGWAALPYNYLFFGDVQEPFVSICTQTLTALLDYKSWESSTTKHARAERRAGKAYLPGSTKKISITTELLTLLWGFLRHLVGSAHLLIIMEALLGVCLEVRREPARAGSLRLACFILHILSQERGFGVSLNEPFDMATVGSLSRHFPVFSQGCWGDFLFLSVYVILSTTGPMRPVILSLQEPLLVVLANSSPLVKCLTATTANKLISLFDVFSSPAFLLSKEHNYRLLYYLLDIFNNIIQYQFAGNAQLIYSLVRHKDKINSLYQMSLKSAISEIERMRLADSKRLDGKSQTLTATESTLLQDTETNTPQEPADVIASTETVKNEDPVQDQEKSELSEKAKGKLPDRSEIADKESKVVPVTSTDLPLTEEPTTPVFRSKCGFKPTEEWFHSWRSQLPLLVLLSLSDYLRPRIEQFCVDNGLNDDRKVVEFLSKETVVGVLPQPHLIMMRSFTYSDPMHVWFTSYFWGTVYLKATETMSAETAKICPPIWLGTAIQLFHVRVNASK